MSKVSIKVGTAGIGWWSLWMFTIAFAKLGGWKILFAMFAWPYYIGQVITR